MMLATSLLSLFAVVPCIVNAAPPPRHLSRAAADAQTSLSLDPSQIQSNSNSTGQAGTPEAGQVASLVSPNNFINFCLTQDTVITNGLQTKTGSCNPTIMGRIVATDKMPSSKFINPPNFATLQENATFDIKMAIKNVATGHFVNPNSNYYAAPCQVDASGTAIGHSHVTVEKIDSLTSTTLTDPRTFAFFKGLNDVAANGVLTATVTGGLPAGVYRLSSINACSNHQPILSAVAQRGSHDDAIYFTVTAGAVDAGASSAASSATSSVAASASAVSSSVAAASSVATASSSVASSIATSIGKGASSVSSAVSSTASSAVKGPSSVSAATSVVSSLASASTAAATTTGKAAITDKAATTSSSASAPATTAAASGSTGNLQTFTGAAGAAAVPVTGPGADGRFTANGNSFSSAKAAIERSCSIQNNACADKANATGNKAALNQAVCAAQLSACNAANK